MTGAEALEVSETVKNVGYKGPKIRCAYRPAHWSLLYLLTRLLTRYSTEVAVDDVAVLLGRALAV